MANKDNELSVVVKASAEGFEKVDEALSGLDKGLSATAKEGSNALEEFGKEAERVASRIETALQSIDSGKQTSVIAARIGAVSSAFKSLKQEADSLGAAIPAPLLNRVKELQATLKDTKIGELPYNSSTTIEGVLAKATHTGGAVKGDDGKFQSIDDKYKPEPVERPSIASMTPDDGLEDTVRVVKALEKAMESLGNNGASRVLDTKAALDAVNQSLRDGVQMTDEMSSGLIDLGRSMKENGLQDAASRAEHSDTVKRVGATNVRIRPGVAAEAGLLEGEGGVDAATFAITDALRSVGGNTMGETIIESLDDLTSALEKAAEMGFKPEDYKKQTSGNEAAESTMPTAATPAVGSDGASFEGTVQKAIDDNLEGVIGELLTDPGSATGTLMRAAKSAALGKTASYMAKTLKTARAGQAAAMAGTAAAGTATAGGAAATGGAAGAMAGGSVAGPIGIAAVGLALVIGGLAKVLGNFSDAAVQADRSLTRTFGSGTPEVNRFLNSLQEISGGALTQFKEALVANVSIFSQQGMSSQQAHDLGLDTARLAMQLEQMPGVRNDQANMAASYVATGDLSALSGVPVDAAEVGAEFARLSSELRGAADAATAATLRRQALNNVMMRTEAVTQGVSTGWEEMVDDIAGGWDRIKSATGKAVSALQTGIGTIYMGFKSFVDGVLELVNKLPFVDVGGKSEKQKNAEDRMRNREGPVSGLVAAEDEEREAKTTAAEWNKYVDAKLQAGVGSLLRQYTELNKLLAKAKDSGNAEAIQDITASIQSVTAAAYSELDSMVQQTYRLGIQLERLSIQRERAEKRIQISYQRSMRDANIGLVRQFRDLDKQFKRSIEDRSRGMLMWADASDRAYKKYAPSIALVMHNMEAQTVRMQDWLEDLRGLKEKGLSDEAIKKLNLNDVSNFSQVERLSNMTPEQIAELNAIIAEQVKLAEEGAKETLDSMDETIIQHERTQEDILIAFADGVDDLNRQTKDAMEDLEISLTQQAEDIRRQIADIADGMAFDYADGFIAGVLDVLDPNGKRVKELMSLLGDISNMSVDVLVSSLNDFGNGDSPSGGGGGGGSGSVPGASGSGGINSGTGGGHTDGSQDTGVGGGSGSSESIDLNTKEGRKMYAYKAMLAKGWGRDQWSSLETLVQNESSWNHLAKNPNSTAYGLFQFLKQTHKNYGLTYPESDVTKQVPAGLQYIEDRYGSPAKALAFWQRQTPNHWYADGGIATQPHIGGVGEAGPEVMIPLNRRGAEFFSKTMGQYNVSGGGSTARVESILSQLLDTFRSRSMATSVTKQFGPITVEAQNVQDFTKQLEAHERKSRFIGRALPNG